MDTNAKPSSSVQAESELNGYETGETSLLQWTAVSLVHLAGIRSTYSYECPGGM